MFLWKNAIAHNLIEITSKNSNAKKKRNIGIIKISDAKESCPRSCSCVVCVEIVEYIEKAWKTECIYYGRNEILIFIIFDFFFFIFLYRDISCYAVAKSRKLFCSCHIIRIKSNKRPHSMIYNLMLLPI